MPCIGCSTRQEPIGASQVPDASLHTCHALMTPADPPESRPNDSFVWASVTLTTSPSALYYSNCNEAVPDFREVRIPLWPTWCPVYASYESFSTSFYTSFPYATLGRGGWLNLTPQGLAPCKKRQALLGALTFKALRTWPVPKGWRGICASQQMT